MRLSLWLPERNVQARRESCAGTTSDYLSYRTRKQHLVLGGSQGIGFAYASYMAKHHGHDLTIVSRREDKLAEAKSLLLENGAASVETVSGDLLDPDFRTYLKNLRSGYDAILVSGPSPPPAAASKL